MLFTNKLSYSGFHENHNNNIIQYISYWHNNNGNLFWKLFIHLII